MIPAPTAGAVRVAQVVVTLILLIKLWISIAMPPIADEAYYWLWGQKLAWSYFDHPPLHAWLLRAMNALFGWNYFSLRILTWLSLGGTLALLWYWSMRLRPADPASWFWLSAAIYLAVPMFFFMTVLAFNDHLLIFFSLLCGTFVLLFAERFESRGRGFRWLYAAAIALGLATLTKYNGALLGIGIAVFFVVRKPMRRVWRSPHLYLAGLLSIAMQAPVLYWNANAGFASFKFHLSERWGGNPLVFHPYLALAFVVLTIALIGPFLFPPIAAMARRPLGTLFADRGRQFALVVFIVSTGVLGVFSFFINIYYYWNIIAYVLIMPLIAGWMTSARLRRGQYVFGTLMAAVYAYHSTMHPSDMTVSSAFGWSQVADRIRAIERDHPVGFVAATEYGIASQLGFAMRDQEVTALSPRHDQFDFWFDPAAHRGEDAIVVTDFRWGTGFASLFESVKKLEEPVIWSYGRTAYKPAIYLAHTFKGITAVSGP